MQRTFSLTLYMLLLSVFTNIGAQTSVTNQPYSGTIIADSTNVTYKSVHFFSADSCSYTQTPKRITASGDTVVDPNTTTVTLKGSYICYNDTIHAEFLIPADGKPFSKMSLKRFELRDNGLGLHIYGSVGVLSRVN